MRAAERAWTSSRSSEELTSSPISASVAKTSAEISAPMFVVFVSVWAPGGFMDSLYYSRRQRACPALFGGFPKWNHFFDAGTAPRVIVIRCELRNNLRPLFLCSLLRQLGVER